MLSGDRAQRQNQLGQLVDELARECFHFKRVRIAPECVAGKTRRWRDAAACSGSIEPDHRGVLVDAQKSSPILRGCTDIWGPTDVYTVRLPLPNGPA